MFRGVPQIEDPEDDPREFHHGDPMEDAAMDPFLSMSFLVDSSAVILRIVSAHAGSHESGHVRRESAFISP